MDPSENKPSEQSGGREHYSNQGDKEVIQLKILSMYFYLMCGMSILLLLIALINPNLFLQTYGPQNMPPSMTVFVMFMAALAIVYLLAGLWLGQRRHRLYCIGVALFQCLNIPIGTIFGIWALFLLTRPAVKALFAQNEHRQIGY